MFPAELQLNQTLWEHRMDGEKRKKKKEVYLQHPGKC